MDKKLSIFFFEGLLLNYPPDVCKEDWLKDPDCLYYPSVPDIPGPAAWDQFACTFFRRSMKQNKEDVMLMTEIEVREDKIDSRIRHLVKCLGLELDEVVRKSPGEETYRFCSSRIGYHLSCTAGLNSQYDEVNLNLNDLELAKDIADYIITEFSVTTVVHDLYSN